MKSDRDDDLAREIRAHLDLEAEERMAEGAPPEEARSAARRAFGNVALVREDARAVWIRPWIDHAWQDLRYAARRLTRAPAFAVTAILILVGGIGLNLAFFQILNVIALRPLPIADPDTLVRFDRVSKKLTSNGIPYAATQFIRRHNDVLSAVLTSTSSDVVWGDDPNDRLTALYVSANWFSELGYGAALGRTFSEALDEQPDAAPAVVVSHDFWRTRLQGKAIAGRSVRVNNRPATIIGVAPGGFPGLRLEDRQIWLLIHQIDYFNPGMPFKDDWGSHNTQLYARLRPGISLVGAREGLRGMLLELARTRPAEFEADELLQPYSGSDFFRGPRERATLRTTALLIGGLMLTVLIVACANLANLILSHAISRLREFSVRAALGATRWRIVRQQLIESVLLAGTGALGGMLVGYWCARIIAVPVSTARLARARSGLADGSGRLPRRVDCHVRHWLRPGLDGDRRRDLIGAEVGMAAIRHPAGSPARQFVSFWITCQVAGCCVLLIVAGSMVRGLNRMLGTELGFEFRQVAVLDASLSRLGISGETARDYWAEVKRHLALPDVEHLALASHAPLATGGNRSFYNDAPRLSITTFRVEPSFFPLLRIPILAGRNFNDDGDADDVIIVSRRLAVEMYGTLDIVGRGFPPSNPEQTIAGIAADAPLLNVTATNVAELSIARQADRSGSPAPSCAGSPRSGTVDDPDAKGRPHPRRPGPPQDVAGNEAIRGNPEDASLRQLSRERGRPARRVPRVLSASSDSSRATASSCAQRKLRFDKPWVPERAR